MCKNELSNLSLAVLGFEVWVRRIYNEIGLFGIVVVCFLSHAW